MSQEDNVQDITVITITVLIVTIVIYLINKIYHGNVEVETIPEENKDKKQKEDQTEKSKKKNALNNRRDQKKSSFTHPWLATSLRGHIGKVLDLDLSQNAKYLASCADDRSLLLWPTKDFAEAQHRMVRGQVQYDHAVKVKWSPDTKAFMVHKAKENCIQIYKVFKKPDGLLGNVTPAIEFPRKHMEDVIGCGMACNGKFIMSCSSATELIVWDLKGEVLANVDTQQMNTYCAQVSPCGRFIATAGFTPDVKVWEVEFSKTGDFDRVHRAFELKGHTAGVTSFCFNNDSTRAATVSKDGTWRLHDTKIEYKKGQEPYLIQKGEYEVGEETEARVALSPDGRVIAIATGPHVAFYSGVTGKRDMLIKDVHNDDISAMIFDQYGKYLITAGDRHIRVFNNVSGYQAIIQDLEEKKKVVGSNSVRERMDEQVRAAKKALKDLGKLK